MAKVTELVQGLAAPLAAAQGSSLWDVDALDQADPIEGSYVLEVSSAGADRPLKKPEHFEQFIGAEVEVRLYRPADGRKDHVGTLLAYQDGDVTIAAPQGERTFPKKDVARVRLSVRF